MARSAVKREEILGTLRDEIVRGDVKLGERLPTRLDLERRFQVSGATIQQALDKLRSEGFVVAHGSRGTFVAENPPHLFQFGLLFPAKVETNRFYMSLSAAAERVARDSERQIVRFHGLDGHADVNDYQRLVQDLNNHRLAGLIFSTPPDLLQGTPVMDMPGVPRVVVRDHEPYDGLATVRLDHSAFFHRAVRHLVDRGRRKIATVRINHIPERVVAGVLNSYGVEARPHWMHMASISVPETLRAVMRLLMHPDQADRPDGLIITDDNLETDTIAGLVDAQVRVPDDLEVICHCNHPAMMKTPLQIKRLGFDSRRVLAACIDLIDRQRRGEPPQTIGLQPIFEGEFPGV